MTCRCTCAWYIADLKPEYTCLNLYFECLNNGREHREQSISPRHIAIFDERTNVLSASRLRISREQQVRALIGRAFRQ